jgi:hypothetical protein
MCHKRRFRIMKSIEEKYKEKGAVVVQGCEWMIVIQMRAKDIKNELDGPHASDGEHVREIRSIKIRL